jgi:hypothetical protein
MVNFVL